MVHLSKLKTIFPKVEFPPLFYLFALLAAFTGNFRKMVLFTILIFVHELGHSLTSLSFGFPVQKIVLYPYGGCSFLSMDADVPLWKELLVLVMGPLVQILFTVVSPFFLREADCLFLRQVSILLLFFNLLPIYPLDGGKLLCLILSFFFSYYRSLKLTFYFSFFVYFVFLFTLFFFSSSVFWLLAFCLLFFRLWQEEKKGNYLFYQFLLKRYLAPSSFKRKRVVSSVYEMKRDSLHFFIDQTMLLPEKEYLSRYFSFFPFLSFSICLC